MANKFGRDYNFTPSLCAKIHLWAKIQYVCAVDTDQACNKKRTGGNILQCMKRAQNKTKIVQWRLLPFLCQYKWLIRAEKLRNTGEV